MENLHGELKDWPSAVVAPLTAIVREREEWRLSSNVRRTISDLTCTASKLPRTHSIFFFLFLQFSFAE